MKGDKKDWRCFIGLHDNESVIAEEKVEHPTKLIKYDGTIEEIDNDLELRTVDKWRCRRCGKVKPVGW